ncbi:MAG: hypothetical protein ACQEW0_16340 [Pseudomonadota bacterium]
MIYLKFCTTRNEQPIDAMVVCTESYSTAKADGATRVYHHPGQFEVVAEDAWLNCFVMSETGKTIDKIEA